ETLTVSSPLLQDLALFLGTQAAVETVLLLLFVSLVVVGVAVILLAARMLVARRQGELAVLRARRGGRGRAGPIDRRGPGRRRRPWRRRLGRLAAGRDRHPGRAGRAPGHRGVAAPQAGPARQRPSSPPPRPG